MKVSMKRNFSIKRMGASALLVVTMLALLVAGCAGKQEPQPTQSPGGTESNQSLGGAESGDTEKLTSVRVVLDWTPNTNHTGLYAAKELGYYEAEGFDVEIVQPGANNADMMVASGEVPFGVSYQENVTHARTQGVPLVSIAAVIQHNTSGFASPASKNITRPKDFEGKTYVGFGGPAEEAVIESLMKADNGDASKLKIITGGDVDFFTAMHKDVDLAWIFYGWTGVKAELMNEPLNVVYLNEYSEKLDYYTPVIVTNEKMIAEQPEQVKAFMKATAKGYQYAIDHPEEAGRILIKAVPDLDEELVLASQKWLSPHYQADAERWGLQKESVWKNYADWMLEYKLIEKELDVQSAYTNDFIPE